VAGSGVRERKLRKQSGDMVMKFIQVQSFVYGFCVFKDHDYVINMRNIRMFNEKVLHKYLFFVNENEIH
jgi:hypothetical protein